MLVYRANMFENVFTNEMVCNNNSIKSSRADTVVAICNLLCNKLQCSCSSRLTDWDAVWFNQTAKLIKTLCQQTTIDIHSSCSSPKDVVSMFYDKSIISPSMYGNDVNTINSTVLNILSTSHLILHVTQSSSLHLQSSSSQKVTEIKNETLCTRMLEYLTICLTHNSQAAISAWIICCL